MSVSNSFTSFFLLTRSLLHDPHVGHADYAPSAGDPPVTHNFNFDNVQKNAN